jgi:DNA-binding PadR family transcriptional regulator
VAKTVDKFESDLLRGSLDLMVLAVLDQGDQYGYIIQKKIREASHEKVSMSAGTMYPLLHRLEGEKLIRSRWENTTGRRRKWNQYAECMALLMRGWFQAIPKPG